MATLCKNCGHPLIFDPSRQKMFCEQCGSTFLAEEVESTAKQYAERNKEHSMEEIYGSAEQEFLNCYVYTCSECGGEIIINGTEASTRCIYCGNSNVVFSRISQEQCPEYIIPFAITKEQALEKIRTELKKGIFVPKDIKNFQVENVRGIYVPYWLVDIEHSDSVVISGRVKQGKYSVTRYFGRAGRLRLQNLPLDASIMLSDESTQRLEPFDFTKMKMFDEDYLLGFYSNVSDVTNMDLRLAADRRATEMFNELAMKDVSASDKKVIACLPHTEIRRDIRYAMLPVWFITFDYMGKHNTILVNGQTGKVVCALPWNKKLFYSLMVLTSILLTIVLTLVFYRFFCGLFSGHSRSSSSSNNGMGRLIILCIAGGVSFISAGLAKIRKVIHSIELTQSAKTFNFMKKRQE